MKKVKRLKHKKIFISLLIIVSLGVSLTYRENDKKDNFIPSLMYHNLDESPDPKKITYTMKPDRFEKHMLALKKDGYTTITTLELDDYIYRNKPLPKKPILITLDDGKTNNYTYAYPILKKLEMKATMFAIVHTTQDHKDEDYLDWERLKEMQDSSFIDIQSHTYDLHHKFNKQALIFNKGKVEDEKVYKQRILDDLVLSKNLIEKNLGTQVNALAYPYGEYNKETEKLAKLAGYTQTYTTDLGVMKKSDSPYLIKRINVDGLCSEKRLLAEIKILKIFSSIF